MRNMDTRDRIEASKIWTATSGSTNTSIYCFQSLSKPLSLSWLFLSTAVVIEETNEKSVITQLCDDGKRLDRSYQSYLL